MERELGYVMDAVRLIRHELDGRVPLIGFSGSPWTLATYMIEGGASRDFARAKAMLYHEPRTLHQLLDKLATAVTAYLTAQIEAGVQAVMLFDTWGGVLAWPAYRDYSLADAVALVEELARSEAVVAIGESGLDYFRTADAGKAAQEESFKMHVELAKALDLPLQIHDREAHADCLRILTECGAPDRTVFHCFSGDREMAEVCADNGWYASFAGPLTYPANDSLREAFLAVPDRLVLVETDAPYLTPAPWRGHPNAPYAAAYTARFMAELRGRDEASWCEQLEANTREVYGI